MKRLFSFLFLILFSRGFSQLEDIKIIIPKETGYSYGDFVQFMHDENYFVVCANSLAIYNTETAEIVDEYELSFGAKNLSISPDGTMISVTINNELFVFTFRNQKFELSFKTNTSELIKGQPNSEYYGALHFGGCFFTGKAKEMYVSIGSFTLLYDLSAKKVISAHTFPQTDYVIESVCCTKSQEVIMAKQSGTVASIVKQSLSDLSKTTEVLSGLPSVAKIRCRDSLLFVYTGANYFTLNLESKQIIHEVRLPRYDISSTTYKYDKKTMEDINRRKALTVFDTINFKNDEYIFDMDLLPRSGQVAFATSRGVKFIDLKTKKTTSKTNGIYTNLKFSKSGKRVVTNGNSPYKALRIFNTDQMNLMAERPAMGNPVTSADVSPNKRWLYTNAGSSGFFWDLRNFSKYVELKDASNSDSSYIYGVFFLNDSEVVVNSGRNYKNLNLSIYNLNKKKYGKILRKNVYALASGFVNGEFYYADFNSLHIINLQTLAEEKYEGLFSLAATNMYQVICFTKNLVFIPESSKYKIVNRKTKKVEYESAAWSVNAQVIISPDNKNVYTTSNLTKKKKINGYDIDMPTNAVVKIDIATKAIVKDYAETYFPYDFRLKNDGKTIGIWYLKHDIGSSNPNEKETMYSEYNTETGELINSKTLVKTPEIITYHFTSESGKYFALANPLGNYFKVFGPDGSELIDLSGLQVTMPKCFFSESINRLIVVSSVNSLATFIDLEKKKIIGQLANANNDNFFLITSDMHYMGSKEFVKNMRFKYQSEIYSFEQFDAYLNQPHRVLRDFGCSDSTLIQAYETAYRRRMKILGLKLGSSIQFASLPSIQDVKMLEGKEGFVNFSLSANKGNSSLSKLEVFNNGTLIFSETIPEEQNAHYEKNLSFETSSGINRFEFVIKDDKGLESPRTPRLFNNTSNIKPNLYLVVIASEKFKDNKYDLAYAVKDASDIAKAMVNSKAFAKTEVKKLFDKSFSSDSVKQLSKFFSKAGINDVVMIFFAGHGYLDTDLSYYFPTYYTDFNDPKINSVAYKDFETILKDMKPTRKLMFIDACFSGEVDEEDVEFTPIEENDPKKDSSRSVRSAVFAESTALEMSKVVFSDLRQNSGATIISSAGGTEAAFEGGKWNNGLFTHCLLEGLTKMKADENHDGKITLNEVQKFVAEEVNRLSEGKQTPTYRMENTVLDYELW